MDVETNNLGKKDEVKKAQYTIEMPYYLDLDTKYLVKKFAEELAKKLMDAQTKHGFTNGWKRTDWMDECRYHLTSHMYKGDPLDVAAYCAFLNYHKEPTFIKEGN